MHIQLTLPQHSILTKNKPTKYHFKLIIYNNYTKNHKNKKYIQKNEY